MTDTDTDIDTGYVPGGTDADADTDIASHWRTGRWLKFVVHEQRIAAPVAPVAEPIVADPDPVAVDATDTSAAAKAKVLAARVKIRARLAAARMRTQVRNSEAAAVAADVLHDKPVAVFRSRALAELVVAEVNAQHSPYPWRGADADAASSI